VNQPDVRRILRIDSSARTQDSVSRELGDVIEQRLVERHPSVGVVRRDLASGLPFIDGDWIDANLTPGEARSPAQSDRLALSDELIAELALADCVLVTAPVYNFSVPSVLKAWIDQVCRAGLTFRYTPDGPVGLLTDRPVYLAMASGGVPFGSPVDFASRYLTQVFRFVGITDVRLVGAERVAADADAARAGALRTLQRWLPGQPATDVA
jgi:FMN-dependent NADH-azoreductase